MTPVPRPLTPGPWPLTLDLGVCGIIQKLPGISPEQKLQKKNGLMHFRLGRKHHQGYLRRVGNLGEGEAKNALRRRWPWWCFLPTPKCIDPFFLQFLLRTNPRQLLYDTTNPLVRGQGSGAMGSNPDPGGDGWMYYFETMFVFLTDQFSICHLRKLLFFILQLYRPFSTLPSIRTLNL